MMVPMSAPYADRLAALASVLRSAGVSALCVGPGADLRYLTGYDALPLERPTVLIVPAEAEPLLIVPLLERARAASQGVLDRVAAHAYGETEDPWSVVRPLLRGASSVAVGDRLWATFVARVSECAPGARLEMASSLTGPLRIRKDKAEVEALRESARIADGVALRLASMRVGGMTERELSVLIGDALLSGCERVNFAIVAAGENAASPHHEPGARVVRPGDAIVCDFGGTFEGYGSDITRTFVVGAPSAALSSVHDVVARAHAAAVAAVRPGVTASSVDDAARSVIAAAGYGDAFVHRTGHGIGLEEHEDPYIVEGNSLVLEPGMAFSIEPGIYLEGRFGVRIEDIVVVTADGVDVLNEALRSLVVLEP
jgi:Xaa-Pro aminopeptidase